MNIGNVLIDLYDPVMTAVRFLSLYVWNIALALIFLAISVLILGLLKGLVEKVLDVIQLDKVADTLGINGLIAKGVPKLTLSGLLVAVFYWLALIGIVVTTLKLVGVGVMLAKVTGLFIGFIPNILSALFVLIIASLAAKVIDFIIKVLAAYVPAINVALISKAASFVIYLYAVILAVNELGIVDAKLIDTLIVIAAVGFVLSAALGAQKEAAAVLKGLTGKKK